MHENIQFGTDGWRAVIADGFTFANVRTVVNAIAVAATKLSPPADVDRGSLVVGYDRRFLSREFAQEASLELSKAGFNVLLSSTPLPSPAVSLAVHQRKALGGVVITASHNPARYNGIKFKAWYGGSALPEIYDRIAGALGEEIRRGGGSVEETNLLDDYVSTLRTHLDVAQMRAAELRILHDPIYGVAAGIPAAVLDVADNDRRYAPRPRRGQKRPLNAWPTLKTVRGESNPSFAGVNPEPIAENLIPTMRLMNRGRYDVAICNDGDSDRLGIIDDRGQFVSPHKIIALLALYLVRRRGMTGEIVKTFSTSRLVERVARGLEMPLHETAVGFKYVTDLMLTRNILIGGEESGGIGLGFFLPERDGVLTGLLVAECIAAHGKKLSDIVTDMENEFGAFHYNRLDLYRSPESCAAFIERARTGDLDNSFGFQMGEREQKDGVKLNFRDGSWLLLRKSGTEPMIRIYCESLERERVDHILGTAVAELDRS
ncbi:MAG TPA: phosphoglucomutase/phosphomannomutase family protein [Thermoanaerobaculia bacterium]|nr:phosphoglucomutase/phosphomannomutase family protein [Thermoanaerobaculia bacterium]